MGKAIIDIGVVLAQNSDLLHVSQPSGKSLTEHNHVHCVHTQRPIMDGIKASTGLGFPEAFVFLCTQKVSSLNV